MDSPPNPPISYAPREGLHIGDLLVVTVGDETAWCQCVCGRHVRYGFAELRKNRKCRECIANPRQKVYAENTETFGVTINQVQADRLRKVCERENRTPQELLVVAVERLLYAYGA